MGLVRRRIRPEGPLRFRESLARFQVARDERVNRFDGRVYRRVVGDGAGGLCLLEAEADGGGPRAPVEMRLRAPERLPRAAAGAGEAALRHILSLDTDLAPFCAMAREDPDLAPFAARFRGLRPVRYPSVFEALVTAITAQQVNLTFAGVIRARMVERWGERIEVGGEVHYAFPRPERMARVRVKSLRGLQFSERKAEYVIGAARAADEGRLDAGELRGMPLDAAVERLIGLRGVGRWTAEQILFRALGRVESVPAGDLGVQKVVGRYCLGTDRAGEAAVRARAARWAPFGSLAVTYLFAAWRAGIPPARGGA